VSDIRSRWVLTRGLTASGGTPLEPSMFAIEGQLSVAKAACMPWASSVDETCITQYKFNPAIASTGPA
jgi:hypothetical protein